jgi:hypothetical protein
MLFIFNEIQSNTFLHSQAVLSAVNVSDATVYPECLAVI